MSQKFLNPVEVNGQVSAEYLDLSTTTTHTAGVGELVWNDTDGTMDIGLKGGNVKLQVGQEQLARVVNKTSPLINLLESDYQVVVITGATGQRLSVKLAQGNNDANSAGTLGVVTETINANQEGFITISGQVREINTTGSLQGETWSDGDLLFLSATTPGAITNIRPIAPNHTVNIGYVEYAHAIHGKIYVKVDNGYELGELHDVDTSESKTTPIDADNLLLQDSADLNVWKKLSWSNTKATLKTYFDTLYQSVLTNPITGTGTTNYLSKFTGTTSLGNSQIFDNGVNIGIGTTTPNSKFTVEGILATKPAGVNYYYSYLRSNWAADNAFELGISDDGASNFHKLITSSNYYNGSTLQFWTNDSERARFDISGNFGIGTTSAFSKVEIAGAATNWANSPAITFTDNAGTVNSRRWLIGNVATDYGSLNFAVSTTNSDNPTNPKMTITKEGNVGIGTTSPSNKLQVSTSGTALASFTGAEYSQFNIIGGSQNFYIQNYNSVSILGTKGASPLLFTTDETERMRITSSGNVGIGTSAPDFKLTVNGSAIFGATSINGNPTNDFSEFRGVGITDGTTSYGSYGGILLSANTQWTGSAKRFLVTNVLDANKFAIIRSVDAGTNPSIGTNGSLSSGTADFVINSSGNVGIGTSSPSYPLEVNGAIVSKGGGIGDLDGTIGFGSPGTSLSGNAVLGEMYFKTGGSEKMRINIAGNVGIGTSSPSNKLEVNGNAYFSTGSSYAAFQSTFSILSNYAGYNAGINSNLGTLDSNYNVILFASDTGNTYPASLAVQSDGSTSTGTTNRQQLSMEGLLQTETVPSDTTNPVKWIKVYNVDDNTHYFIPAYQ